MASSDIKFGGMSANTMYSDMLGKGVSSHDAALIVSAWIFQNVTYTLRSFSYQEPFPQQDPAPLAAFVAQFHHKPWRDGEDAVQAGPSADDEGFNKRFDNIRLDIDALAKLLANEFAKIENMRQSLFKRFDEIRAELNRINADLLKLNQDLQALGGGKPDFRPPLTGLIDNGMYLGTTTFMNKKVNVWRSAGGQMMMMPYINPVVEQDLGGKYAVGAGELGQVFTDTPDIKARFPNAVKKKDLVERFGDVRTESGLTIREVVAILPENAEYASLDKMIEDVADRNAAVIRTTTGGTEMLGAVLGTDQPSNLAALPVTSLPNVSSEVKAALVKNNVKTLNDLANLDPQKFANMMNAEGIRETAGTGAKLRGMANTMTRVR